MYDPKSLLRLLPGWRMPEEGACLLADSLEALRAVSEAAGGRPEGLTRVGLRLVPEAFDDGSLPGIRAAALPSMAAEIRKLPFITVQGCFVAGVLEGVHGEALGRFFRAGYESAKRMSAALPCAMPYLCWENVLPALAANREEHPESLAAALRAAEIVAMQNRTAFYARLYVT